MVCSQTHDVCNFTAIPRDLSSFDYLCKVWVCFQDKCPQRFMSTAVTSWAGLTYNSTLSFLLLFPPQYFTDSSSKFRFFCFGLFCSHLFFFSLQQIACFLAFFTFLSIPQSTSPFSLSDLVYLRRLNMMLKEITEFLTLTLTGKNKQEIKAPLQVHWALCTTAHSPYRKKR